jgi:hypothetical protein
MVLLGACSAGKGQQGSNDNGGSNQGGSAATGTGGAAATGVGGANPSGGAAATSGMGASTTGGAVNGGSGGAGAMTTGGASGTGNGGAAGAGAVPPGGDAGTGGQVACQDLTVVPTPQVPTVAIVVDNSSSMHPPDSDAFSQLYDAMMNSMTGAIAPLEGKIRFGFTAFRGRERITVPETDNTCAELTTVPYALNNYDEINTVYQSVGQDGRKPTGCGAMTTPDCGERGWETPSGHALGRIAADLGAFTSDPPGRKYMLFVTDGTPNTCQVANPNCGQDLALKAMQDAYAAGIGTFVVGIGDILSTQNCDPGSMRCGRDALQDMANAGAGQPVALQPMSYWYLECATRQSGVSPGTPSATYVAADQTPGTATYYLAMTPAELRTALTTLLTNVVSCTIQLDATVNATADPSLARITVGGTAVPYNTADGWILEPTRDAVTLQGAACSTFRGGASVNVVFPCQNGRPIGM